MQSLRALGLVVALGTTGCGDDAVVVRDGAVTGDAAERTTPAAPAPPAAPTLWPCAPGWRGLGSDACDPWPEPGRAECADGEAHFPGEPGCAIVGPACPEDGFPADLPLGATVIYARAGAPAGGDGSRAAPFGRIGDAIRAATAGAIVALARGTYDEGAVLRSGISLWGACAAGTILQPLGAVRVGVEVVGVGSEVRNLTITGPHPALSTPPGVTASFHAENVIIQGVRSFGILLLGAGTSTARSLIVRDVTGVAFGQGRGVEVEAGGRLELERAVIERAPAVGIYASGAGTSLLLDGVAVLDTTPTPTTGVGRGIAIEDGAVLEAHRVVIERATEVGLIGAGAGTMLVGEDIVVRDTRPGLVGSPLQRGVGVQTGATASLVRTLVERNGEGGLAVSDGSTLSVEDSIVRDIAGRTPDGEGGDAISASGGSMLTLSRLRIERVHRAAVLVTGSSSSATIADAMVADVGDSSSTFSRGIEVSSGATVRAERVDVVRFGDMAFFAADADTRFDATDLGARDAVGSTVGTWGRALDVQLGAVAVVTRASFVRMRDAGVVVLSPGSSLELSDALVDETLSQACEATMCPGGLIGSGEGIGAYDFASASVTRFVISRAMLAGVQVAYDGSLDLDHGRVERCAVGANVQVEGYDYARLSRSVEFVDNERTLDATRLPTPSMAAPL